MARSLKDASLTPLPPLPHPRPEVQHAIQNWDPFAHEGASQIQKQLLSAIRQGLQVHEGNENNKERRGGKEHVKTESGGARAVSGRQKRQVQQQQGAHPLRQQQQQQPTLPQSRHHEHMHSETLLPQASSSDSGVQEDAALEAGKQQASVVGSCAPRLTQGYNNDLHSDSEKLRGLIFFAGPSLN